MPVCHCRVILIIVYIACLEASTVKAILYALQVKLSQNPPLDHRVTVTGTALSLQTLGMHNSHDIALSV